MKKLLSLIPNSFSENAVFLFFAAFYVIVKEYGFGHIVMGLASNFLETTCSFLSSRQRFSTVFSSDFIPLTEK